MPFHELQKMNGNEYNCIHNTLFSFNLEMELNKLEHYPHESLSSLVECNTLTYWAYL